MKTGDAGPWIQTASGGKFHFLSDDVGEIRIVDIASALSKIPRFCGHSLVLYPVAQHCVLGSYKVPAQDALWFLLHDGAEAYQSDIPSPLKHHTSLSGYRDVERLTQSRVYHAFGLYGDAPASVKEVDNRMLATEVRDLCGPGPIHKVMALEYPLPYPDRIVPMCPSEAEVAFLARFEELTSGEA